MLKNYLKIAFRNIVRHKGYSLINIMSLTLGLACFIMMMILVKDELRFDGFHQNRDVIYRVLAGERNSGTDEVGALSQAPLAAALKQDFPEIIYAACFNYADGGLVKYRNKSFMERDFAYTDPDFFKMFSFRFIKGNPDNALDNPSSVVITERIAHKYFGSENPLGKVLQIKNITDLTVTGVIETPKNSHIPLRFVVHNNLHKIYGFNIDDWERYNYSTYVMLQENCNLDYLHLKLLDYLEKKNKFAFAKDIKLILQPLKRIYLHSNFGYDIFTQTGSIKLIYLLSLIAAFVLLAACINFINLATARSGRRQMEVGMRKTVGAQRSQLIVQFLSESVLLSFIALFFALFLVELFLPHLNRLTYKMLTLRDLVSLEMISGIVAATFLAGLLAGSYPALYISALKPARIFQDFSQRVGGKGWLRKVLVVSQFCFSIILIIVTITIYRQLDHMQNAELGYDKEHLAVILMDKGTRKNFRVLKNGLLDIPGIDNVTGTRDLPYWTGPSLAVVDWEGKKDREPVTVYWGAVDYDYINTYKIKLLEGRTFSPQFPSDSESSIIINQAAAAQLGLKNPVGKYLMLHPKDKFHIIGVVKNFHFDSVRVPILPYIIFHNLKEIRFVLFRVKPETMTTVFRDAEKVWRSINPDYPFEYRFLDRSLSRMYRGEQIVGEIALWFSILAVFISSLGLFGLASFTAEQRTKEIGIRKALGASVSGIVLLFSKEYMKLVLLSNIIAWPAAYFLVEKWLQDFAYRIDIGVSTFILAGSAALATAILTVSYQSIKASTSNPVDALKYE